MSGITRYIFRQLALGTVLVSIGLAFLVWLTQSLQFLQYVINKGLAIGTWLKLTVLLLPWFLSVILPAALFLVVLFIYNKLIVDRELVVAQAAGVSRLGLARPALLSAAGAVAVGYSLTLLIVPASFQAFRELQWNVRNDVSQIMLREGMFNQLGKDLTVYVRGRGERGDLLGVLIHDTRSSQESLTIMAERGAVARTDVGSRIHLINGSRQVLTTGTGNLSVLYFDSYELDFGSLKSTAEDRYETAREISTWALLNASEATGFSPVIAPRLKAQGHQRLVDPLNALGFACIGLAFLLTGAFNRHGQVARIVAAIAAVTLVQAAALGAVNLAGKNVWFIPLMYVVSLLPIAAGMYIIMKPGWRFPAQPLPPGVGIA
jgi:lipopolysaccharide export system permease protein